MAKKEKSTRRRSSTVAAFSATTGAAIGYGVARYKSQALSLLPHGFDSEAAGQGKPPLNNKRVLICAGLALWAATSRNKKVRRWAPFAGFLLGASVHQHQVTYQVDGINVDPLSKEEY